MKRPTVHQAHAICESVKARAVMVIALSGDGVVGASYGETKLECQQVGFTLDWIIDGIEAGRIPVWETSRTSAARTAEIIRRAIEEGSYCPHCKVPWSDCDCESRITAEQYNEGSDL